MTITNRRFQKHFEDTKIDDSFKCCVPIMTYFIVFDDRYGLESIIQYFIEYRFSIIMIIENGMMLNIGQAIEYRFSIIMTSKNGIVQYSIGYRISELYKFGYLNRSVFTFLQKSGITILFAGSAPQAAKQTLPSVFDHINIYIFGFYDVSEYNICISLPRIFLKPFNKKMMNKIIVLLPF